MSEEVKDYSFFTYKSTVKEAYLHVIECLMCEWVCKWVCEYCTVVPETTGVHTESSQVCRVSHD